MRAGTEPPRRPNPFSPMAVARITGFDDSTADDLTVETGAIAAARDWLAAYLRAVPTDGERAGEVIAVVGDYGTGKTHLALDLVRAARRELGDDNRALYVDATAGSFVELHRRFLDKLGFRGVRNQVNNYYADVVADALLDSGLGSDVVDWLRNRDVVPQQVVDRLGLMESELLRTVQRTLRRVTDNRDFATALTLLLRTGFDEVVWRWLTGEEPADVLVERGITAPIDNDVAALEAMGVLALLYGGRRATFVLVIDELDKLLAETGRPEHDVVPAFEKMLQVFASAGSCLVVCALPEAGVMLRPSTRQRVSRTVELTGLSQTEVVDFVRRAYRARLDTDDLTPFTVDLLGYLRDTAGGNARKVIRLCHDVFRLADDAAARAGDEDLLATDEMVLAAAAVDAPDAAGIVRRVLSAHGWTYQSQPEVDFFVTFPDRTGGVAVQLVATVRTAADALAAADRVSRAADGVAVLVVTGMLAAVHEPALRAALGADPLRANEPSFAEHLTTALTAAAAQLPLIAQEDPVGAVRQRLDVLTRQQTTIYDHIDNLADRLDEVRGGADRRLAAIQRDIAALAKGTPRPAGSELPAEVDRMLTAAVAALDELTELDATMTAVFTEADAYPLQRRLAAEHVAEAHGVAALTKAAVLAFRVAVTRWYTTSSAEPARLEAICQTYDDVVESLPMHRLWPLASGGTETGQALLRERVEGAVGNLSPRVLRALRRAVAPE